jgi:hypothetical protein
LLTGARIATIAAFGGFVSSTAFAQSSLPEKYSIEGVKLGDVLASQSVYSTLTCSTSEVFQGSTWCERSRQKDGENGAFTETIAYLQSWNAETCYLAKVIAPAFFAPNEFTKEINRLSYIYHQQASIWTMPRREGLPTGVIAAWGDVTLLPLDAASIQALADGKSVKVGFIVDFLQDFQRSAREGLPIYVLSGGAGMIWNASADETGRGKLRISAIDASKLSAVISPQVVAPPPVGEPQETPTAPLPHRVVQAAPTPVVSAGNESCSAIADAAERLSCYDKAAGNTTPREVPLPSPSPSLPRSPAEPVNFAAVTKAPSYGAVGTYWDVSITIKDNNLYLRNIVINRGNCDYGIYRGPQLPANVEFGNVLRLVAHCDPLEILLQSSLGDDILYFNNYVDIEGGISVSLTNYGLPRIIVTSHVDDITIYNVTVNRGNCAARRMAVLSKPSNDETNKMLFGQRQSYYSDKCDPIEVAITTSLGTETFTLK